MATGDGSSGGRLAGKVALITGAGMGQGREACRVFSREGAKIIGLDIDEGALRETCTLVEGDGGEIASFVADVSMEDQVREAVEGGYRRFSALHIVYNNAGVLWRDRDLSVVDTPRENWDRVIAINLTGAYLVCKYAVPKLIEGGGGAILNVGSISAVVGFTRPQDAYTCAKGALIALTKSLAVQYGKDHIRANIIHPGFIDTPMQAKELVNPDFVKAVEGSIPLGRIGRPNDIAQAALFLCSDEASWVTGAELVVDGGFLAT
ncbi:MAG TPA: SDR family NAD(P)-dependent oxidoreductase [Thermoleophilia bacterium]|nr:SDR family NAD(P)-dependent oxidoreductase [Thermoleophilia bacterium]